jgi:hypothetical protein
MFETILPRHDIQATPPRLVIPNDMLDFWGDQYLALPELVRRRMTFEHFLVCYRVRNGALFEKIHCPAPRVRNSARHFRKAEEAL